jgi:hypothetical protein
MDEAKIRAALNYLNSSIGELVGSKKGTSSFGLRSIKDSRATMLWVKRGTGENVNDCWYILQEDGQNKKPIYQKDTALTGLLTGLSLRESSTDDGKTLQKVSFWMQCGTQKYRVESGLDTVFTRGVLLGLCNVPASDVGLPLSIGVKPSDETSGKKAQVVFGNVFDSDDNQIKSEWSEDLSCTELLVQVGLHFGIEVTSKAGGTAPASA